MPRKKQRVVHPIYAQVMHMPASSPKFRPLLDKMPKRIQRSFGYHYYKPAQHVSRLGLDRKFFSSLSKGTKVLEIGAGSGRLAEYLLKHSKLMPENYTLMDTAYRGKGPWMKRGIYNLAREGQLKLARGSLYSAALPANAYDHILIPEAFFPGTVKKFKEIMETAKASGIGYDEYYHIANSEILKDVISRLKLALRQKGTIRISSVLGKTARYARKNAKRLFPGFIVKMPSKTALVFEKC